MTSVMVHAARLDFTAPANLGQSFRTFIKELTEMEKEFFIMVVNFATSVQDSQGLLRVGAKNAFIYQSAKLSDAAKYATYSNHYSTATSRQVVNELVQKIQTVQGFLRVQTMAFMNEIKYTGLLIYSTRKDEFVFLQNINGNSLFVALPGDCSDPDCSICVQSRERFSKEEWDWVRKRNNSISFTQWNLNSGRNLNFTFGNFSYHAVDRPWYKLAASLDTNSAKLQFTEPNVYAVGSRGNISNVVTGAFSPDIHDTLQNYLQTPNAFIYVTSTEGILVGTVSSDTMVDAEGRLILAKNSNTKSTQVTGKYLLQENRTTPGYIQSLHGHMLESGGFSFQVRTMDKAPFFVIVNGAPKSDYTGEIDLVLSTLESALANNMEVVVGISMAVFIVAVAASCALTYYSITVPLSKTTIVLRDATNFDFTAYKRLQKQKYNYIREFGTMEHVFYLLIAKFATSIRSQDTLKSATASVKKGVGSHLEQRVTSRLEVVNSMWK
ncbi:hypothetical protein BJ741DRAFT_662076 [Chytriomyces cf. hyalinus JEL632]|nr:hypothetical protein BJ741DRAFT_662076 [Chytriomyces cf. hyalinus JEL632]